MLTLRLLGGFALLDETGASVTSLSQRRAEAVLAVLGLCGDLGCTRDRLATLLWPEATEEHARHNLRSALHAVRAAVGQEIILSSRENVRLNSALVDSDVRRFANARASSRLEDAVAAYGGPLLDGFHVDGAPEFERQIEEERARLFRQCAEAIESLARDRSGISGPHGGATWWARAVEHDPLNTRLVVHLMRALAEDGDPANALVQAELHKQRLQKELEIEPDEEVEVESRRIRETLRNHAVPDRANGRSAPVAPASGPALTPRAATGHLDNAAARSSAPALSAPPAVRQLRSRRQRRPRPVPRYAWGAIHGVLAAAA